MPIYLSMGKYKLLLFPHLLYAYYQGLSMGQKYLLHMCEGMLSGCKQCHVFSIQMENSVDPGFVRSLTIWIYSVFKKG